VTPVRIIGIGSPHGADRIGWLAIEALQQAPLHEQFPDGVISFDCCSVPTELHRLVDGCRLAVLVDAVLAGETGLVTLAVGDLEARRRLDSVHGVGVGEMLELIQLLADPPPQVEVIGIRVSYDDTADAVDRKMRRLLPELRGRVLTAVRKHLAGAWPVVPERALPTR